MNNENYWSIRKKFKSFVFRIKVILYRVFDRRLESHDFKFFWRIIIRNSIRGSVKAILVLLILASIDNKLVAVCNGIKLNDNIVVSTIIGGIGVAGVILGLYCSSIAAIYSSRYVGAPAKIAGAFQNDKLTNRCISGLVNYIIFGMLLITTILASGCVCLVTYAGFLVWSIAVIISYSVTRNRIYLLSDVYNIADDSYSVLERIISKSNENYFWSSDANFQNHFRKIAEAQIETLKAIQKYAAGNNENNNTSMVEFMHKNLLILNMYWLHKKSLYRDSLWFKYKPKYPKWHFASEIESSTALSTGTSLRTENEHNYWWFEEELIEINKACLKSLFKDGDFSAICSYLNGYDAIISSVIVSGEASFFVGHVEYLRREFVGSLGGDNSIDDKKTFAAALEQFSLLYLSLIIEINKYYEHYCFDIKAKDVITSIDKKIELERNKYICASDDKEFYQRIITELKVEGRRITPDWVIIQKLAKEEYLKLNSSIDVIKEGIDKVFDLGKLLLDSKMYFEACIILTRFYEYESKLGRFRNLVEHTRDELISHKIDESFEWDKFRLDNLSGSIKKWKKDIPNLLFDSSTKFAINNWNNREEYPDYLGDTYNHICEDAVEAIINNDLAMFEIDFENLSKIMLLYQEYIRSDFIKKKELYRVEYAYYMFTSPIVEWAQIAGLAILWGEFNENSSWQKSIEGKIGYIFTDKDGFIIAERLIEYVQHRDRFMFGIGSRDMLETGWRQAVESAVHMNGLYEVKYNGLTRTIKNNSKLIKSFCSLDFDLHFLSDPSEIFWVICVNPMLSEDKRYHTRNGWEKRMYDETIE